MITNNDLSGYIPLPGFEVRMMLDRFEPGQLTSLEKRLLQTILTREAEIDDIREEAYEFGYRDGLEQV